MNQGVSRLGRIEKGIGCSVGGCGMEAVRSISGDKVKKAGLNIGSEKTCVSMQRAL
jgi:hypothetical protein